MVRLFRCVAGRGVARQPRENVLASENPACGFGEVEEPTWTTLALFKPEIPLAGFSFGGVKTELLEVVPLSASATPLPVAMPAPTAMAPAAMAVTATRRQVAEFRLVVISPPGSSYPGRPTPKERHWWAGTGSV